MTAQRNKLIHQDSSGSALVMLLLIMTLFATVTTAAITISYINNFNSSYVESGEKVLGAVESASDNAVLRIIRSSTYPGESLTVDSVGVTITVSTAGTSRVITSTGILNQFRRQIRVSGTFTNGIFNISEWKETT